MILDLLLNADLLSPAFLVMVLAASSFTSMLLSVLCAKDCGTSDMTKTTSPRECQKEHLNKIDEANKDDSKKHPGRTPETLKTPSVPSFPEEAKPFSVFNKTVEYSNGSSDVLPVRVKSVPTGPGPNVKEKTSVTKFPLLTAIGQGKTAENFGQATKDPKPGKRPPLPAMKELEPEPNQQEQDELAIKHLQRVNTTKHFLKELMEKRESINVKTKNVCDKNVANESVDPTQKRPMIQLTPEGKVREDEYDNSFSVHALPISTGWPYQIELIEAKQTTNRPPKQVHHHHHHHHHQHRVKQDALRDRQTLSPVNPKDAKPRGEIKVNPFHQNIKLLKGVLKPESSLEKNKTQMCPSDRRRYVSLTDVRKPRKS